MLFGKHFNSQLLPVTDSQEYLLGRHATLTASEKWGSDTQPPARLSKGAFEDQKHLRAVQEAGLDYCLNVPGMGEMKCEVRHCL